MRAGRPPAPLEDERPVGTRRQACSPTGPSRCVPTLPGYTEWRPKPPSPCVVTSLVAPPDRLLAVVMAVVSARRGGVEGAQSTLGRREMDTVDVWVFRDQSDLGYDPTGGAAIAGYHVEALDGSIGKVDEANNDVGPGVPDRRHRAVDLRQEGRPAGWVIERVDPERRGSVRQPDQGPDQGLAEVRRRSSRLRPIARDRQLLRTRRRWIPRLGRSPGVDERAVDPGWRTPSPSTRRPDSFARKRVRAGWRPALTRSLPRLIVGSEGSPRRRRRTVTVVRTL